MRKLVNKCLSLALPVFMFASAAHGGGLTNYFNSNIDFLANGVIGTMWDGVYFGFGDIPGGDNGGDGAGFTSVANETTIPGFLIIQTTSSTWAGTANDGFFLYKTVAGDFDVSVLNSQPFNSADYHFAGLMARAANKDGTPYAGAENWVGLTRFQRFNVGEKIFYATNGVDFEFDYPGDNADTNSDRYLRITRVGDVFSFYHKTNSMDEWALMQTVTRTDLTGVPVQVGLEQTLFTPNSAQAYFTDFELTGPNVTTPVMPPAPINLVTTATNIGGSLTFSWTLGRPGDSSLVVMSRRPIQHNPLQGQTYTANAAFGDSGTLLGGGGEFVVYSGTGTSVTVTNLGANNLSYYVAVYEYTGSGASTVYNTASPAVSLFPGPGTINSVSIVAPTKTIPVNGAVALRLMASFSTGESNVDQTANATWSSANPPVADTGSGGGVVCGLSAGSAVITASFGKFNPTVTIDVHGPPVYSDDFSVTQDYVANGLIGSTWDGLFLNYGDVPGGAAGADGPGATTVLLAETNGLSMTSLQSTWQAAGDDGPFLFKVVTGDFQAVVHVNSMNTLNFTAVGLMARLFDSAHAGPGPASAENHVNYWKVQNGSTSVRQTTAGDNATIIATGPSTSDRWLLLQRANSTNFFFYEKAEASGLWTLVTNTILAAASGDAVMQVGVAQQTLSGVNGIAVLDSFSLDGPGIVSPTGQLPPPAAGNLTAVINTDLSMTFTWTTPWLTNGVTAAGSILVMRAGAPVSAQPTYGIGLGANSVFGTGQDLGGGNYIVYKSPNYPSTTNNTVTVTGLTPGVVYYAAVYTYSGPYGTRVFNNVVPPDLSTNLQDGRLLGIEALPTPSMPLGGIGTMEVYGLFTGGARLPVSQYAEVTSGDTNLILVAGGVLTGVGLGSAPITLVYGGFTNESIVTVRPPGFTDNFGVNHDYLATGVTGTGWDGIYRQPLGVNEVPDSPYAPGSGLGTAVADANSSSNGVFTLSAVGDGWENDAVGGLFLFKYVPGDFQVAVHINSYDISAYNQPGLLARAYSTGTNGTTLGAPYAIGSPRTNSANITIQTYGETWVSLTRFDEYGIGTYARKTEDSATSQNTQADQDDGNFWLLISRKGTQFDFYKRASSADAWVRLPNKTQYSIPGLAGAPMQVGLMAGAWWWSPGDNRTVRFENFMLDCTTGSSLQCVKSGPNVVLSWPPYPNARLQYSTSLNPSDWKSVPGTPDLGPSGYSLTLPITSACSFFRLAP